CSARQYSSASVVLAAVQPRKGDGNRPAGLRATAPRTSTPRQLRAAPRRRNLLIGKLLKQAPESLVKVAPPGDDLRYKERTADPARRPSAGAGPVRGGICLAAKRTGRFVFLPTQATWQRLTAGGCTSRRFGVCPCC